MKVTFHPASREDVPALVRALLAAADNPARVQVASVGPPGVTVDIGTATRFLAVLQPAAAPAPDLPPDRTPRLTAVPAAPHVADVAAQAEHATGLRQPRKQGRPRKPTTASSEG